ncbi:glycosyltransferase family 4 protein [Rothia nasimurium]|uniref:glycosyltransferase family 4 protein n=1 Tax=Rothia nasimurium TaxID=85336 RepID=UPI001F2A5CC9|nr:glycosyltransferase family 4 protein [Rothia nasimurium]
MKQEVIFVGHTSKLGGGELALSRYITWEDRTLPIHLIVFEHGKLSEIANLAPHTRVTVLSATSLPQRVLELNKLLKESNNFIVSNSISAFLHLSLVPAARHRVIDYLRQEAYPFEASLAKKSFLKYFAYPSAKGFLSNSEYTLRTLTSASQERRGRVVYTVSGRSEATLATSYPGLHHPLRVLSLSRLSPWKGVHVIMEAVNLINSRSKARTVELTVAGGNLFGEPEYSQKLKKIATASHGAIKLIGNVSDVSSVLSNHDVLVSASTDPEPFGQILVQGSSAGLVTIGTSHGGATEIITDKVNGLLTAPGDAQDLAAALEWIISHPQESLEIRKAGVENARRFTDEQTLPLLEDALLYFIDN